MKITGEAAYLVYFDDNFDDKMNQVSGNSHREEREAIEEALNYMHLNGLASIVIRGTQTMVIKK